MLDRFSLIGQATVFGSLLTRPQEARDVDIAFVVNARMPDNGLAPYLRVLRAGAYGTPRYGYFDAFVSFTDSLWVRNDDCLGFVRSKSTKEIRKAIAQGMPWTEWRAGVTLSGEPEPAPARRVSP